jgi:hypothetical protein
MPGLVLAKSRSYIDCKGKSFLKRFRIERRKKDGK